MRDQRLADRIARADDQREHAFGQAAVGYRFLDRPADEFGRAEMRRMRLHDNRTTRRERGRPYRRRPRKTPAGNCSRRTPRPGQRGIFCRRKSGRGNGLRSGCAESSVAPSQRPSRTSDANSFSCPIVRPRSPSMRAFGSADSACARSISVSPSARMLSAIASRNCARVSSDAKRKGSNAASASSHARADFFRAAAAEDRFEVGAASRVERPKRGVGTPHGRCADQHFSGDFHVLNSLGAARGAFAPAGFWSLDGRIGGNDPCFCNSYAACWLAKPGRRFFRVTRAAAKRSFSMHRPARRRESKQGRCAVLRRQRLVGDICQTT